jgi:murein L,D-transpeptidase YafK
LEIMKKIINFIERNNIIVPMLLIVAFIILTFLCWSCDTNVRNLSDVKSIDSIVVKKQSNQLIVYGNNKAVKLYCATGKVSGKKHFQGDRKTPEGVYYITSGFRSEVTYKSLKLSYPNANDRAYARKYKKSPGGDICIHGFTHGMTKLYHRLNNWTCGCIALTNKEMDAIFTKVDYNKTKVIIY